jgi:hypothetical protein
VTNRCRRGKHSRRKKVSTNDLLDKIAIIGDNDDAITRMIAETIVTHADTSLIQHLIDSCKKTLATPKGRQRPDSPSAKRRKQWIAGKHSRKVSKKSAR